MLLPLVAAYLLFAWITVYNDEEKVEEYLDVFTEIEQMKTVLNNPILYHSQANRDPVERLANDDRFIALYNKDGLIMYTSNPAHISPHMSLMKEQLYEGLYNLEQGYHSFSYKQPVFESNDLVGFFYIEVSREEWVAGVSNRTAIISGLFILFFILIYLTVVWLVNKKLNVRLTQLMDEMSAFAAGQPIEETEVNNDEIGKLKKHFYHMRREINQARETIEQEQRTKEYMIASISHDLKTPLTSIKAYAESLYNQSLTKDEQEEYQHVIVEKSQFMQQMLDDLLMYTLLQSPTYEMEFAYVDGKEFFDMLVSGYEPLCEKKNIHLQTSVHVDGKYELHPQQMIRVVDNLMSNAIQHTDEGGHIWLTACSTNHLPPWIFKGIKENLTYDHQNYVYLIIQNEGKGIREEHRAHVFNPLFQVDQSRSKRGPHGTGLGLSISKQIIEKHHGTIQLYSKENEGTCVICRLPKVNKEGIMNEAY